MQHGNDTHRRATRTRHADRRGNVHPARHPSSRPASAGVGRSSEDHARCRLQGAKRRQYAAGTVPGHPDKDRIREFGKLYHEAWWAKRRDEYGWKGKDDIPPGSVYEMPSRLADEIVDAPVIVLALSTGERTAHSVFPPVQNLLLAARALGIGSVLTTLHPQVMERVYAMLEIPPEVEFHCCIPLGYPRGRFGPTRRFPTSETTSWERWNANRRGRSASEAAPTDGRGMHGARFRREPAGRLLPVAASFLRGGNHVRKLHSTGRAIDARRRL